VQETGFGADTTVAVLGLDNVSCVNLELNSTTMAAPFIDHEAS